MILHLLLVKKSHYFINFNGVISNVLHWNIINLMQKKTLQYCEVFVDVLKIYFQKNQSFPLYKQNNFLLGS